MDLNDAAREENISAERLSRLVTRTIEVFEAALSSLTRRGRPPKDDERRALEAEIDLTRALLHVAARILSQISLRRPAVRELIVGAWHRLHAEYGVAQRRFCALLGLRERTLRSWLTKPPSPATSPIESPPKPKPKPRQRGLRRRHFDFDATIPDTQLAGDTTDISVFGVDLKLVASQDIGGRDEDLFDAVIVDTHECSDHVVDVLSRTLKPGTQVITDQGTPYLADATRAALEALEAEHAPQKEADPQGKATLERAFGTAKSVLASALGLTTRLADLFPALRNPDLAKHTGKLLVTIVLKSYQAGARATRRALSERFALDPEALERLADKTRERARATEHSVRLFLEHIHALYELPGTATAFVRKLRPYPLAVLQSAEKALRDHVYRRDIWDLTRYFAAIVRNHHAAYRSDRLRAEEARESDRQRSEMISTYAAWRSGLANDPARALRTALECLAAQWLPHTQRLLLEGQGLGRVIAREAMINLTTLYGITGANDVATASLRAFAFGHSGDLGPEGIKAVSDAFRKIIVEVTAGSSNVEPREPILTIAGVNHRRPPPEPSLRI